MSLNKARFYYGEKIGERFKGFAYDDYPIQKSRSTWGRFKTHQIDYVRIELWKLRENTTKKEINKDCTLSMPDWSEYYDSVKHLLGLREVGFTRIFEHLKTIEDPVIVETGTVRKENSFEGDGCSTVLFDHFVGTQGGTLISVDIDPAACKIADKLTTYAEIVEADSVEYLATLDGKVDFTIFRLI